MILLGAALTGNAYADMTHSGYMRSGTGLNSLGGKYQYFKLPGIPGNPERLGNEVGTYGELSLVYWALRGDKLAPFFKSQVTLGYAPPNNAQFENSTFQAIEAYLEGGYISAIPFSLWVGKRFYRDGDVHIHDLHYFADMSGTGAGLRNYNLGFCHLDIAFLLQSSTATSGSHTSIGAVSKEALDFRLRGMAGGKLDLWIAGAFIPPASGVVKQLGEVIGLKYKNDLANGSNIIAAIYGVGAMTDLGMAVDRDPVNLLYTDSNAGTQSRVRLVESFERELSSSWALLASLIFERAANTDIGGSYSSDRAVTWYTVGARPLYSITDNIQWVFDLGTSTLRDETGSKTYWLARITTGPQLSLTHGQWARPVLRAFVTRSQWNDGFMGYLAGLSPPNDAYSGKQSAIQIGFQGEIWF